MTPSCSIEDLKRVHILSCVKNSVLESIAQSVQVETYKTARTIRMQSKPGYVVMFVFEGRVRLSCKQTPIREMVIQDVEKGDYFADWAFEAESEKHVLISALTPCRIGIMPEALFMTLLLKNPTMTLQHLQKITRVLRNLSARMGDVMFLDARTRIQKALLELMVTTDQGAYISELPKHAEIAFRADTQREVVSRELSRLLQEKTLVKTSGGYNIPRPELLGTS